MNSFVLFLMGKKGLSCLEAVLSIPENNLKKVVFATDKSVENDYSSDIISLCNKHTISCNNKNDFDFNELKEVDYCIAISWRWLINDDLNKSEENLKKQDKQKASSSQKAAAKK